MSFETRPGKGTKKFLTAERKGFDAYILGYRYSDCPYKDKRTDSNKITWSRAFMWAWQMGYRKAQTYFGDIAI